MPICAVSFYYVGKYLSSEYQRKAPVHFTDSFSSPKKEIEVWKDSRVASWCDLSLFGVPLES